MDLIQYIRRNYNAPNPQIVKDLGGSDELIEYLRYTPWNTNSEVAKSIVGNESNSAVVGEAVVGTAVI